MAKVWRRRVQKGTKKVYYVNTLTKKTQWKSPGDDKIVVTTKKRRVKSQPTPTDGHRVQRVWKMKVQKKTGKAYYVVCGERATRRLFSTHAASSRRSPNRVL